MSRRFQNPLQQGVEVTPNVMQSTPVVRIRGVETNTALGSALLQRFAPMVSGFLRAQRQNQAAGGLNQWGVFRDFPEISMRYVRFFGRELLEIVVRPEVLAEVQQQVRQPLWLPLLDGLIVVKAVTTLSGDLPPTTATLTLNGTSLGTLTFRNFDVLFGGYDAHLISVAGDAMLRWPTFDWVLQREGYDYSPRNPTPLTTVYPPFTPPSGPLPLPGPLRTLENSTNPAPTDGFDVEVNAVRSVTGANLVLPSSYFVYTVNDPDCERTYFSSRNVSAADAGLVLDGPNRLVVTSSGTPSLSIYILFFSRNPRTARQVVVAQRGIYNEGQMIMIPDFPMTWEGFMLSDESRAFDFDLSATVEPVWYTYLGSGSSP